MKQENACFRDRLDEIIRRIKTDIGPAEEKAARQQIPLLKRLLTLGQRKSLTQWQRQMLGDWIQEILELLQSTGQLNEDIADDISRYDAFRLGIELDEASTMPLHEQLRAHFERQEMLLQEQNEARRKEIHREVERVLDQTLGPEPSKPEHRCQNIDDLFRDELKEEQRRQYDDYQKARNATREELLAEMLVESSFMDDEEDNDFDFSFNPFNAGKPYAEQDDSALVISNVVFTRLFSSTAAQLHPDREHDPDIREEKQALMSQLLYARKQGDVMMIVQMYQEHVSENAALPKTDEKQLLKALKRQVDELQCEQEEYYLESPLHHLAYERFYSPNPAKTDQAFKHHIKKTEEAASEESSLALNIKSLKTLKPHLEQRYDEQRFIDPQEALDAFFNFAR